MKTRRGKRVALATVAVGLVAVLGAAAWRGWPHLRFWSLSEPLRKGAQGSISSPRWRT